MPIKRLNGVTMDRRWQEAMKYAELKAAMDEGNRAKVLLILKEPNLDWFTKMSAKNFLKTGKIPKMKF